MRGAVRIACCLLAVSMSAGCGVGGFSGLYNAQLPGGADVGDHPYRVTAHFADVLDLVPQAAVKVNDVGVGRVERIGLSPDNTTSTVTLLVNGDVRLPGNADARLRQSSLLGEKFVELSAPAPGRPSVGDLRTAAVIPRDRTNRNPQVEEVLGALSMLLNGGGVAQLQVIVRELNNALSGNEAELRGLLGNLNETVTRLDAQRGDITRAIDGLDRLSTTLRQQTGDINTALNDLGPGIRVLHEQRGQLVAMLRSLDRLSGVTNETITRSRADMVADLHALTPTLQRLTDAGADLPKAVGYLSSYPFPEYAMNPLKGDFVNVDVRFDLNLDHIIGNLTRSSGPLLPIPGVNDAGQPVLPLPTIQQPVPARQGPEQPGPSASVPPSHLPGPGPGPPEFTPPSLRPPSPASSEPSPGGLLGGLLGGD